ncbi:MAG TPA: DUF4783 domain-containing protein [Cytophagaceae bacterium]|jgi:hypothetical protein|nr:DUF4783 domain-containing protein [Cytophagaceae bacterium]
MKKVTLLVFKLLLISHLLLAQEDVMTTVKAQFKLGNAKEIARYFNDIVEISVDGEKGNYSKSPAEFVLRDFFKENPPIDFQKIHQGSSKEGLNYMIGKYTCGKGTYRVYIVVKQFKGNYLIDNIDFSIE